MRSSVRFFKSLLSVPGGGYLERLWARAQLLRYAGELPAPLSQTIDAQGDCEFSAELLLTTRTGILHYANGSLRRILQADAYGLAPFKGRWYFAYRLTSQVSQIASFELRNGEAADVRCELPFLHPGLHQLDFCGEHLLLADTTMNRLARYACRPAPTAANVQFAYPNGRVWRGRRSPNYAHLNSVLSDGETTLVVFHNQSRETGKPSELLRLNRELRVTGRRFLNAKCAHNVIVVDGRIGYCDSMSGDFVFDRARLKLGAFTRGVAVDEERLFIGGSEFASREKRQLSDGLLYGVRPDASELLFTMRMPGVGGVYEVRLVRPCDGGLSEGLRVRRQTEGFDLSQVFDRWIGGSVAEPVASVA